MGEATNLSSDDRAAAQKHIDDCKALLASEKAKEEPIIPAPPPSVVPSSSAPAAVAMTPTAPAAVAKPRASTSSKPGSGLRTAGILTASVGGAALVAGIVLNYEANSLARDLEKTDGYTAGKESDRKTYETISWVSYGVGAACVAAGAILYVLGSRSPGDHSVAFVPTLTPDHAGAVLTGSF